MAKKEQMGFAEAKPTAAALANFLQQLRNAEAVLDAAIRADVEVKKLRGQAEDLRDEIEDLQGQRDHVKELFDSERSRFGKLTDKAKIRATEAETTSQAVVEEAQKRSLNATTLHEVAIKDLEANTRVRQHRATTKVAELRTIIEDWEHKLRDAKQAHADFVAKITRDK